MSELISFQIDGKTLHAKEGESVLNVARANDIFIPAVCYLTNCSATLACRLCLVEADGKQVYSCNTKVKEGMSVLTSTESIQKERRAIMEVYDVNHPLQCGVCDQSGECELQNYSLYMKVDSQSYSITDTHKVKSNWGVMNYDPALCIVCERCVTVCKDMIGSNALSTTKRGSEPLSKELKTTMPKDAYAMWNKLNKSLISYDSDACVSCGECISVCPVGALVSKDFQYTSNAWELTKIPASNAHSSDCAFLYYEIKDEGIFSNQKKIYRVTNEFHYEALNGAARFGYDFENKVEKKDEVAFKEAIEALKKAKNIKFNSFITNEEALILSQLSQKTGAKLVNNEAKRYQEFLNEYAKISGKNLYSSSLKQIHEADFIISIGSYLKSDLPSVKNALNNAVVMNKASALYFHALEDTNIEKIGKKGKTTEFIYHKPFIEEQILYFILYKFGKDLPTSIKEFINSTISQREKIVEETIKEKVVETIVDEESGEEKEVSKMVPKKVEKTIKYEYTSLIEAFDKDETFLELLDSMLLKKENFKLIIGEDLIFNKNAKDLAKLCAIVEKYTSFEILIIPPKTNSLGVSLLCELEDEVDGFTFAYNEKGDFQISALGDGNLDMPALNQQEGTFTNINKRVVPTNAALKYKGYTLNDLANEILPKQKEYTIEYTNELSANPSFVDIDFDSLENEYTNAQEENRGYLLNTCEREINDKFDVFKQEELSLEEDELIIYSANPINQFNEFTAIAHELKENLEDGIFFSHELFEKLELEKDSKVLIKTSKEEIILDVFVDNQIKGNIPYISTFMKNSASKELFKTSRYNKAKIGRV